MAKIELMADPKKPAIALNVTEERLKLALRITGLGIFDWFPMKSELIWDEQMCFILGFPENATSGTYEYFFSVLHPVDRRLIEKNFARFLDAKSKLKSFHETYRIKKNDQIRHIEAHGTIFRNEKGLVQRIIGTAKDITEQKLALEKVNLQAKLLAGISEAIISTDKKFRILTWNQAAESLYGWKEEEVIGKLLGEVVPTIYLKQHREKVIEEFMSAGIWKGEVLQMGKNQEELYIQASIYSLVNEYGKFQGAIGINRDISDNYRTEQALRKSEERFRSVFNQQFQYMIILTPDGIITELNELPLTITGAPREAFIGKYFWEAPVWEYLPEQQEKIKNQVLMAAKQREPIIVEDKYHTASGEIRYAIAAYTGIYNNEDLIQYILVQATDITERKLAEEELKRIQEELSKLNYRFQISTEAAQIGIWDWEIKSNHLLWDVTTHKLYGLRKGQFKSTLEAWFDFIHPDYRGQVRNEIDTALAGDLEFNTEFRIQWTDYSIRYIKATATVQTDLEGNPERMIGIQWDITQEKEAEIQRSRARKLELQNQELELFAYLASHDLQEPLRTVKSFVRLLEENPESNLSEKESSHLFYISQAANRMSTQIKDLLDYSRIGRDEERRLVDSESLLQHVKKDLWAQIVDTKAKIEINPLPVVNGYQMEMRILLQNLISNALKFHKDGVPPLIQISARPLPGHWEFCIKDNGIGIDQAFIDKIFLIFQRLHPQEKYEGTGIGLAHCHKIVDLHGGRIWVESTPGVGSAFYFTIPS